MFKITDTTVTREIEAEIDANGISYATLMQHAGRAIAARARARLQGLDAPQLTILVGPGNNGGDGLVAGLFIAQDMPSALVRFYLLKPRADDDEYLSVARSAGLFVALSADDADKRLLRNMIASSDLVIDALFGIGMRLPLRDEAQKVLRAVRQALAERAAARPDLPVYAPADPASVQKAPLPVILAVDVPSGINADTGEADQYTLAADETVTFITVKKGLLTGSAVDLVGSLYAATLGVTRESKLLLAQQQEMLDSDAVARMLPRRSLNSHKGTYGRVAVVGGSRRYRGAPLLAAQGALRAGAGLVTAAVPHTLADVMAAQHPDVTWQPLPDHAGDLSMAAEDDLNALLAFKALVVGCGMGQSPDARAFLGQLLAAGPALPPLVLDADALNLLAQNAGPWPALPAHTVLTPHPAELARLLQTTTEQVQADRFVAARQAAEKWGLIVVLKGAHTLIAQPDGRVYVSPFKTDALARAGSGDILAGVIGGLLAQGATALNAASAGVYMHGLAGVIAARDSSARSVTLADILSGLGAAIREIER
jgi:NAD(P)H-hydrate epimerase